MSEYSDSTSISKFMGSNPGYVGYDDNKYILNTIKDNPNAVIVLDEIDKAHPKIINLLYQILEDGQIKDAKNNVIKFNNNIIIMTSNKGSNNKHIGFNEQSETFNSELIETFNIAFLNRIDDIIKFNSLNSDTIEKIIKIELNKLTQKYDNLKINISTNVIKELIDESKYKEYGARKIIKNINNKIESIIIDGIISENKEINIDSLFSK